MGIEMTEKKEPEITIITPTWKRPIEIIERCIRSVDSQTHEDWEHIICSDGYEENVEAHINAQKNPKRKYMKLKEHGGIFANNVRQAALERAKGKYIVFLDDDNIIFPHYLEKMLKPLKESKEEVAFTICQIIHMGPLPEEKGEPPQILTGIPVKVRNVDTLQLMIKKDKLLRIGGWNQEAGYLADGYTFEELAKHYQYIEVPEILCIHI